MDAAIARAVCATTTGDCQRACGGNDWGLVAVTHVGGAAGDVRTIMCVRADRPKGIAAAWGQRDAAPYGDTGAGHTTIGHVAAVMRMGWATLGSLHFSLAILSYFSMWISAMATQLSSMATQLSPRRGPKVFGSSLGA